MNKENGRKQGKVILIVEDEFDLGSTLSMLFQLHGFETLRANNGVQALDILKHNIPDIVLSDCMMPVMDGIRLTQAIRANQATAHLPIVLMSAAPQQHNLSEATFNAFVQKPFQFADLLETVLEVMPPSP